MNVGVYPYPHGDPVLIDKIVNEFLSQGKFDKLRKECMSDADTKPAYQNLQQRVESTVTQFLKKQVWRPDLNKNQLRDTLRKHILDSNFFDAGINRIVDQVVNPNVLATVFLPEVEEVVYNYLSIPKPPEKAQKRGLSSSESESLKPPGSDIEGVLSYDEYDKSNTSTKSGDYNQSRNGAEDKYKSQNSYDQPSEVTPGNVKTEPPGDDDSIKMKVEEPEIKMEVVTSQATSMAGHQMKIELPSDDSQESIGRMGVERLRISETEAPRSIDSDDSMPLEINEKSMSESRDSEDSIMNQMSPISQGRLTPDLPEEAASKPEKDDKIDEDKKPLTFIGRIPKINRNDSESSSKRDESGRTEKIDSKTSYSSDESDSSKSYGKSDSDDKKSKEQKKKDEKKAPRGEDKKRRDDSEKKRRDDDRHKKPRDRDKDRKSRDDRSKDSKDQKKDRSRGRSRDRSRDRHRDPKKTSSTSSSSREKTLSHKSSHHSRHRDSKSKDRHRDKKRKEDEKKKSKSTDDHGRERNKKDDRRSTDRDSNERDRTNDNRSQGDTKRRDKEAKADEGKTQKTQKEDAEVEEEVTFIPGSEEVVIEMDGELVPEGEQIVLINEHGWLCSRGHASETKTKTKRLQAPEEGSPVMLEDLLAKGALTKVVFPKITEDFYVKFNSTGFRYFEDWERCKLDCEEEFKDFVDEAESNLDLISDEGSEPEAEFDFEGENRRTLTSLKRGLGNFVRGLTFDPTSCEFYKWTNESFYLNFRNNDQKRWIKSEKTESDESTKENIMTASEKEKNKENLAREKKALHLKLLNRLKRRAIRQGKQRRRCRRKGSREGIKEKNDNPNALAREIKAVHQPENGRLFGPEVKLPSETESSFLGSNHSARIAGRNDPKSERGLLEGESQAQERSKPEEEGKPRLDLDTSIQRRKKLNGLNLTDKEDATEGEFKGYHIHRNCHLPLSPDSDDCNANSKSSLVKEGSSKLKRHIKVDASEDGIRERKQQKRSYCQKYDSQDLYKPRPMLNSSRVRARGQQRADETRHSDPQEKAS